MKPTNLEQQFVDLVRGQLAPKHTTLIFTTPSSGSITTNEGYVRPAPDLIVRNPVTGQTLLAELKFGGGGAPVPYSTLPTHKSMKASFPGEDVTMVVFAIGDVPPAITTGLEAEKIQVSKVKSLQEV